MTDKRRESHLLRRYGISVQDYEYLFDKQEGKCGVCSRHQDEFKTRLAVDHNHKTGQIRGLLCAYCNHRLIGRHTDPELLRKMAEYLDNPTPWFVPAKKPRRKRRRT